VYKCVAGKAKEIKMDWMLATDKEKRGGGKIKKGWKMKVKYFVWGMLLTFDTTRKL